MAKEKRRKTVVLGLLGTTLDAGHAASRWERWRPTVDLHGLPDLIVDRMELFFNPKDPSPRSAAPYETLGAPGVRRAERDPHEALAVQVKADIRELSPDTAVQLHRIRLEDPWDFAGVYGTLLDVARAYPFRDDEDYLIHLTTGSHVAQICLFLLTEARWLPGRLLQVSPPHRGHDARGRGTRPPGSFQIFDLNLATYDLLGARLARIRDDAQGILKAGIATRDAAFNHTIARIEQVATASTSPLLLLGPTGAGKSFLASRIYELKRARHQVRGAFVAVNCATIRGDGAMSALFGHAKGAFTGALTPRDGLLVRADGGVLFLDEIGELGLEEQGMLLRALEEKTFLPLGADKPRTSDFQLLSGTNRDLGAEVAAGRFREDLYARIRLWTFRLPGLAERRADIAPNVDHELARWMAKTTTNLQFPEEAKRRYLTFAEAKTSAWTGNFRDLAASIERLVTLAPGGRITLALVEEEIARLTATWATPAAPAASRATGAASGERLLGALLGERAAGLDRFDRVQLTEVLAVCAEADSLSEAGRQLFDVSRLGRATVNDADRLRKYLAKWGLTFAEIQRKGRG